MNTFGLGETGRCRTNVWDYAGVNTFRPGRLEELELHPTVKPTDLVADAIKDCSRRGDIVLDPFGGSGTTLIAAQKSGRLARLIEYDPSYCDVIVRWFEAVTGTSAVLARTGQSFEDVAPARSQFGGPYDRDGAIAPMTEAGEDAPWLTQMEAREIPRAAIETRRLRWSKESPDLEVAAAPMWFHRLKSLRSLTSFAAESMPCWAIPCETLQFPARLDKFPVRRNKILCSDF